MLPGSTAVAVDGSHSVAQATLWRSHYIDCTGFYYLGARYYDPQSGRFLSPDPLGHGSSVSLYDYANGDPVNGCDPDGRLAKGISAGYNGGSSPGNSSGSFDRGYLVGAMLGGSQDGAQGGASIAASTLSFGASDHFGWTDSDQYQGGFYTGSRVLSTIGRETLITAVTLGAGNVARAGSEGAYYGYATLQGANAARSGYQMGTGIDEISQGHYLSGSLNLFGGGLGMAGGLSEAGGLLSQLRPAASAAETTAYKAIGSTGQIGESALKQLGGDSQVFFQTSQGGRYVDQVVNGIATEAKVGYQSLTPGIRLQVMKDVELM